MDTTNLETARKEIVKLLGFEKVVNEELLSGTLLYHNILLPKDQIIGAYLIRYNAEKESDNQNRISQYENLLANLKSANEEFCMIHYFKNGNSYLVFSDASITRVFGYLG